MTCWDPLTCPVIGVAKRAIGQLTLHIRRVDDEWHAALRYETPEAVLPTPTSDAADDSDLGWRRWVVGDSSGGLTLTPVVPDRPVVVRPRYPLSLASGEMALFYVTVPAWLQLTAQPAAAVLLDVPTVLLSKIWFGDFDSGELCYSIVTRATRHLEDSPGAAGRITCPLQVSNRTGRELLLERLCIHVQHLGLFEGGGRLWTPVVGATFRDDDQTAEVVCGKDPPPECPAPVARSLPRTPPPADLFWRAFRELASINLF